MKVVTVHSREREWEQFVSSAYNATAYHQIGWKNVIQNSFRHHCHYIAAIDDDGIWCGVLPLVHMQSKVFGNFLVSMPFVNYGGILSNNAEASRLLLDEAERLRQYYKVSHVELRHVQQRLTGLPTSDHKVTMILQLKPDIESQWKAFDAKLRNQIRKAEKSGLQLVVGHLELLNDFYDVFSRNMRDLGTPVYAKRFFRNVLTEFADTTKILAVTYQGKTIGAGIASWFRDTIEIPWASSIRDYRNLCPNNMLYWEAIRFAIGHGFHIFDFGRSTPHEGTYNFKKQWGALPVQLYWQYLMDEESRLPELNPSNPKYRVAIRVWQRLPVPVTKVLGPPIVRNIP